MSSPQACPRYQIPPTDIVLLCPGVSLINFLKINHKNRVSKVLNLLSLVLWTILASQLIFVGNLLNDFYFSLNFLFINSLKIL